MIGDGSSWRGNSISTNAAMLSSIESDYQAALRLADLVASRKVNTQRRAVIPIEKPAFGSLVDPPPYRASRKAAIGYVSGSSRIVHLNAAGSPSAGKNAPDRSHSGIRIKFVIAGNACVESIRHAIVRPTLVSANDSKPITIRAIIAPANVVRIPATGANARKIA